MISAHKYFPLCIVLAIFFTIINPVLAAPATPTGFSQVSSTDDSVNLKWTKVSGATKYVIYLGKPKDDGSLVVENVSFGDTDVAGIIGLVKDKSYTMWINACDDSGCSDPSAEITTKTGKMGTTGASTTASDIIQPDFDLNGVPVSQDNYGAFQHTDFTGIGLEHMGLCMITGLSPAGPCVGVNGSGEAYLFKKLPGGGALGGLAFATESLYTNRPTSTTEYLAGVGRGFGISNTAIAQGADPQQSVSGSGQSVIAPVLLLWQVMRNLAYLVMIIVFMVIGFMIMFRQKMNPQAVISVQAALPGLVIGLILITFSYFISALIIDSAFLGVQVVAQIFNQVKESSSATTPLNAFNPAFLANNSSIFDLFNQAGKDEYWNNAGQLVSGGYETLGGGGVGISVVIGAIVGIFLLPLGPFALIGAGIGAAAGAALPLILGLIVPLILILALMIQMFRLFFKMLNSYIMILISTITAPFFILASIIPGQNKMLGFWWKNLLGHSLIFPAVLAVFLFAGMILATNNWNSALPFFGGLSTVLVKTLVAYGIILGLPAVPDIVKKAIGAQDIGAIGQEGIKGFSGAFNTASSTARKGGARLISPYVEGANRYREAKRARALGRDRYDDAQSIERTRQAAAEGSGVNRFINRVFYRFNPVSRAGATREERLAARAPQDERGRPQQREGLRGERNLFGWSNNEVRQGAGLPIEGTQREKTPPAAETTQDQGPPGEDI